MLRLLVTSPEWAYRHDDELCCSGRSGNGVGAPCRTVPCGVSLFVCPFPRCGVAAGAARVALSRVGCALKGVFHVSLVVVVFGDTLW